MTLRRLAALKPWPRAWAGPLSLSLAVHAAIVALALGLAGLAEPPRPDAVIPVELVFASAPSAKSASDHPESSKPSSSFPRKQKSSDTGPPLSRRRRGNKCGNTSRSCTNPADSLPRQVAATAKPSAPVKASLPDHVPLPPVRAAARASRPETLTAAQRRVADDTIMQMLDAAAAKAAKPPPIIKASVSNFVSSAKEGGQKNAVIPDKPRNAFRGEIRGLTPHCAVADPGSPRPPNRSGRDNKVSCNEDTSLPTTSDATAARQATRANPASLIPPRWGRSGLGNAPPVYPLAARRNGAEGRVVLRVRVDVDGHAEAVEIVRSSGHDLLDEAARRAVAAWRFVPGRLAGIPVPASVDVPVVFRLKD